MTALLHDFSRQSYIICIVIHIRGVYTRGEWCEMHHGENWGGDVVMIMMLLLESIIIYYYMHEYTYHFTPVHF